MGQLIEGMIDFMQDDSHPDQVKKAYGLMNEKLARDEQGRFDENFTNNFSNYQSLQDQGKQQQGIDEWQDLEAEDPLEKWRKQIDALITSGNPVLMKEGLKLLGQQQNRETSKDNQDPTSYREWQLALKNGYTGSYEDWQLKSVRARSSGSDGLSWEEYQNASPEERRMHDSYNRFQAPASIQKADRLSNAAKQSPEAFAEEVRNLGMDKFLDLDDRRINAMVAHLPEENQQIFKRELANAKTQAKIGEEEGQFLTGFSDQIIKEDSMYDNLDYSVEILNELSGLTDYSTTGFASWLRGIPTTDAGKWANLKETLTSRLGLDKLMELKEGSATGSSGLGALSEKELNVLQTYMGNLDQARTPGDIRRVIKGMYGQIQKTQNAIRSDQARKAKRYKKLAPSRLSDIQTLNVDQWLDIPTGETTPLEGRQSEASRSTPEVRSKPFGIGELVPSGLKQDPKSKYKIGQIIAGDGNKKYEYIGGPDNEPGSFREVGQ